MADNSGGSRIGESKRQGVPMDKRVADLIVKGKRLGDPKVANVIDVMPGTAPKLRLRAGDVVQIGKEGMRFEPGEYIILPLEQWARTLSRAVANSAPVELETHQPKKKRSN